MGTYVVRVWLPDRPGALGAVASRIGAVRGDVVGIDILETGGGQAVDELVVRLPEAQLVELLVSEISQVDGVKVEEVRLAGDGGHDPRLDALETAAVLVGASTTEDLFEALCEHGGRTLGAGWVAVVDLTAAGSGAEPTGEATMKHGGLVRRSRTALAGDAWTCSRGFLLASTGPVPAGAWLAAFLHSARAAPHSEPADLAWTPLAASGLAVVVGREHPPFRARERRQLAALARIVDRRARDLDGDRVPG